MDPRNSQGPDRIDYSEAPGDLTEVHAAIQREHRDPSADTTPIPLWLTAVCGAALVWAGGYFMTFHGGLRSDVFNERLSSPDILFPQPVQDGGPAGAGEAQQVSLAQAGKAVYSNCQPCHQANGQGVAGQFPTLVGTDYVKSEERLVALILKGVQGPLKVGDATYNGAMPAWEKTLSNKKIAQVASYVRANFGNSFPEISEAKVEAFKAQVQPWDEAGLLQLSDAVGTADAPAATAAAGATPGGAAPAAAAAKPAVDLMAIGKANYATICGACHQPTGMGLPAVFPPLSKTEYVTGDPKRLIAIVLKGVMGPITVDGKPYNNIMPGQGAMLNDEKIAGIATYVRKSFGNDASEVTPDLVAQVRAEHAARANPWTEAELKAMGGAAAPAAAPAP
jgi:mono/diheme cytochrome c family protein